MIAICRRLDGEGGADAAPSEAPVEEPAADVAAPEASAEPAPADEAPGEVVAEAPVEAAEPEPAPVKPAAKPAAAKAGGARPSVAEMMAMARAEKSGAKPVAPKAPAAEKSAGAAKVAPAAKPAAAKPAADKAKPTPASAPAPGAAAAKPVKDTASILAAARGGAKPGPVSKSAIAPGVVKDKEIKVAQSKVTVPPMPVKPAAAKPKEKPPADDERRSFMQLLFGSFLAVGFTTLSAATGLWTLGLARFMFPNILTEPPSRFKVGFPTDFPPGSVEEKFKALFGVWIVNTEVAGQREIFALRTVCTHLGCTPNWLEGEQKFKCPCHGSGFYKDGINFEGPAPRPLERYSIRLADDGQLEVDKSKLFQEELGQWTDPASFVSV
ncbi:MAG TPA: Rieske 2Fe-2S domain-containing protein [Pirellulales bacterium]|nr:Rieske 2Fe-2S domain-containing protein [Pirellulales bacterium]